MRYVYKNLTGQPWGGAGHDDEMGVINHYAITFPHI